MLSKLDAPCPNNMTKDSLLCLKANQEHETEFPCTNFVKAKWFHISLFSLHPSTGKPPAAVENLAYKNVSRC